MSSQKNPVELGDIDVDVMFIILGRLELTDLISVAETNKKNLMIAQYEYLHRYARKTVKIFETYKNGDLKYRIKDDYLYLYHYDFTLRFLKCFGYLISNLEVEYSQGHSFGPIDITEISKAINLHCGETLVKFTIVNFHRNFFDHMTKPFEKLEELSIRGLFNKLGSHSLTMDSLFPAVRDLSLNYVRVTDTTCIHGTFSQLKHLYVDICRYDDSTRFSESDVERMIERNPQIQKLSLSFSSRELLSFVNRALPNLENLQLYKYSPIENSDDVQPIHFQHVNNFTIESTYLPENISFERLIEIYVVTFRGVFPGGVDGIIKLITDNKHLEKFILHEGYIDDEDLKILTETHLNIEEIFLVFSRTVKDASIIDFVRNNERMQRIHFRRNEPDSLNEVAEILQEELGDVWKITLSEYDIVLEHSN